MSDRDRQRLLERRRLLVASALAGLSATSCDKLNPFRPCLSIEPVPTASADATAPTVSSGSSAGTPSGVEPGAEPLQVPEPAGLGARPLVAVYERDPWAMVIGSDVPSFVLYADGTVILSPITGEPPGRIVGRTADARALSAKLFALLENEPVRRTLWGATDQPTTAFLIRSDKGWIQRTVYGMTAGCKPSNSRAAPVPAAVRDACAAIAGLSVDARKPWAPGAFEVMLWGFEHSRGEAKPWPPAVPAPPARKPLERGVVKHRISPPHHAALKTFLSSLAPNQAVSHAGHKWSVATRAVVPADEYLTTVRTETWLRWAKRAQQHRP